MVGRSSSKREKSDLESQIIQSREEFNEDFFEANELLKDNDGEMK